MSQQPIFINETPSLQQGPRPPPTKRKSSSSPQAHHKSLTANLLPSPATTNTTTPITFSILHPSPTTGALTPLTPTSTAIATQVETLSTHLITALNARDWDAPIWGHFTEETVCELECVYAGVRKGVRETLREAVGRWPRLRKEVLGVGTGVDEGRGRAVV
ncbi:hypothetical protein PRZ48_008434 [Zasmidium cellare]|uniref:Uncharacterized protein n=1 Tax=Zasmidium cellare TaxID=395010 RepID=A0ABR0EG32_ZASCE|nr:hypothetical protein PRZ48_008434 [Zasmidium cellare]